MSVFLSLSTFALRELIAGACETVGFKAGGEVTDVVVGFLTERFTDHSQRLTAALQSANEKAWTALEIALAGDSLWERCKVAVARAEDKAFAQQVRTFLDAAPLPELAGKSAFRQKCLEELRAARKARTLSGDKPDPRQLARQAAEFARFGDPASLVEAEWRMAGGHGGRDEAGGLRQPGLAHGTAAPAGDARPGRGRPLLLPQGGRRRPETLPGLVIRQAGSAGRSPGGGVRLAVRRPGAAGPTAGGTAGRREGGRGPDARRRAGPPGADEGPGPANPADRPGRA